VGLTSGLVPAVEERFVQLLLLEIMSVILGANSDYDILYDGLHKI